jgi:hypothetical protein
LVLVLVLLVLLLVCGLSCRACSTAVLLLPLQRRQPAVNEVPEHV